MSDAVQIEQRLLLERKAREEIEEQLSNKRARLVKAVLELRRLTRQLQDLRIRGEEERRRLEAELQAGAEQNRRLQERLEIYAEMVRRTGEPMAVADCHGWVMEANPAYERAMGLSREEIVGSVLEAAEDFQDEMWPALHDTGQWAGEICVTRENGERFQIRVTVVVAGDHHGDNPHYIVAMAREAGSRRTPAGKQAAHRAKCHDPLTRLPNRVLLKERLEVAARSAAQGCSRVAVIHIDIDQFHWVNETLGRAAGDRLLKEVSRHIGNSIRLADTIARTGGDKFTILLTELADSEEAVRIAERLINSVSQSARIDSADLQVSVSAGISFCPDDGSDAETLLKHADLALRAAQEQGRRQCRAFSPEMVARNVERFSLSMQLERAIEEDAFELAFQPILNVRTGIPDSVEALIRWQRPGGQWLSPDIFIPHAEATGLIERLDRWVLERACRCAARWVRNGAAHLGVAVNLSAISVQQPDMAEVVASVLAEVGLPPQLLTLEITETAVIADPRAACRVLECIVALGVRLAVDDFGTGHSSLSYLTQFPFDSIKLDRQFVHRIGADRASETVIQGVLELARRLGLKVVAEGIEQDAQQRFLAGSGCELMQGFHLVAPLRGEAFDQWLSRQGRPIPSVGRPVDGQQSGKRADPSADSGETVPWTAGPGGSRQRLRAPVR